MTATELFLDEGTLPAARPRFVAIEALREKRTGLACDERSDVETLKREFPHVDFSDVERGLPAIPIGEDNVAVRERARAFTEGYLPFVEADFVALISHKGWLRELRNTLKRWVDEGRLKVDFDVDDWHQALYKNAEIRVAEFGWIQNELNSVVSRSVDNAISSIVASYTPVTP
jgi:broad specificity phosphatase PhoE